jgi:chromosome segregation ATPase
VKSGDYQWKRELMSSESEQQPHIASLTEELGRKLQEQRSRVRAAVDQQRERLHSLEEELHERFSQVREAVEQAQHNFQTCETTLTLKTGEIKREEERLHHKQADLAKQRGQLEALVSQLEESQQTATTQQHNLLEELSQQLAEIRQRETQLSKQRNDLTNAQRDLDHAKRQFEDRSRAVIALEEELLAKEDAIRIQEAQLEEQQKDISVRWERTQRQRASLAKGIRRQRKDIQTERAAIRHAAQTSLPHETDEHSLAHELIAAREEIHQLHASLQNSRHSDSVENEKQLQELRRKEEELARQQDQMQTRELECKRKRTQLALEIRAKRKELLAELEQKQAEIERIAYESKSSLAMRMAEAQAQCMVAQDQAEKERTAREALEEKLRIANRELEHYQNRIQELETLELPNGDEGQAAEVVHLQQRLEMALDDLREERARNQELLAQPKRATPVAVPVTTNAMDWEARKRSLLAQLESDYDENIPEQRATKLSLEDTIARTDEVVAAKDAEIARLQAMLQEHPTSPMPNTAAVEEILNHEEVIREEREKLQLLQDQLREQFRQAEIDLSVERAKIARERLEIEEKTRNLPQFLTNPSSGNSKESKTDPLKKQASLGGRWLARLGLSETDE